MKVRSLLILAAWGTIAFAGQPKEPTRNSEQRMEDRSNNASVLIGTGTSQKGGDEMSKKDTRPQGKVNKDESDLDIKKKK